MGRAVIYPKYLSHESLNKRDHWQLHSVNQDFVHHGSAYFISRTDDSLHILMYSKVLGLPNQMVHV